MCRKIAFCAMPATACLTVNAMLCTYRLYDRNIYNMTRIYYFFRHTGYIFSAAVAIVWNMFNNFINGSRALQRFAFMRLLTARFFITFFTKALVFHRAVFIL